LDEFTAERAAQVLAAALEGPGGKSAPESVLASFAEVPGVEFVPARAGGLLRKGEPARLDVGQWRFLAGDRMRVSHVVGGVVLKTSDMPPVAAARLLADALLDSTWGSEVQAVLYGMAVVHGLL
jgi:hypothetical protein